MPTLRVEALERSRELEQLAHFLFGFALDQRLAREHDGSVLRRASARA